MTTHCKIYLLRKLMCDRKKTNELEVTCDLTLEGLNWDCGIISPPLWRICVFLYFRHRRKHFLHFLCYKNIYIWCCLKGKKSGTKRRVSETAAQTPTSDLFLKAARQNTKSFTITSLTFSNCLIFPPLGNRRLCFLQMNFCNVCEVIFSPHTHEHTLRRLLGHASQSTVKTCESEIYH